MTARRAAAAAGAIALLLGAAACANEFQSEHHDYRVVTVVDGLEHPWGLVWLPDGDMLVTERPGRVRIVRDGELLPEPVEGVPAVRDAGQGGLLDVALHPEFESNRLLYLSYSKPDADRSRSTTAVARGRYEDGRLLDVEDIFEAEAWSDGAGHYGSRLAFDHDGYLFVTIGDRQMPPRGDLYAHVSQDNTNHMGTIVRLYDDGGVPQDNPFVGDDDALPEIWSYGHRNQQGLAVHPETGDLWSNEHGPQGGDELNYIEPGLNYGWPVIGYGVNYGGAPIHEDTHHEGMEQPVVEWTPSIGASGLLIYDGDRFPEWQGSIFSGGLASQRQVLSRVTVDGAEAVDEEFLLEDELRIRDVRQSPDGYIYIAVDHRGGNLTPIVRLEPVN